MSVWRAGTSLIRPSESISIGGLISSSSGRSSWVSDTHEAGALEGVKQRGDIVRVRGPLRDDLNDDLSRFVQLVQRRSKTPDDIVLGSFNSTLMRRTRGDPLFHSGPAVIAGNHRTGVAPVCSAGPCTTSTVPRLGSRGQNFYPDIAKLICGDVALWLVEQSRRGLDSNNVSRRPNQATREDREPAEMCTYVNEYLSGPQPALDEGREVGLPNTKEIYEEGHEVLGIAMEDPSVIELRSEAPTRAHHFPSLFSRLHRGERWSSARTLTPPDLRRAAAALREAFGAGEGLHPLDFA